MACAPSARDARCERTCRRERAIIAELSERTSAGVREAGYAGRFIARAAYVDRVRIAAGSTGIVSGHGAMEATSIGCFEFVDGLSRIGCREITDGYAIIGRFGDIDRRTVIGRFGGIGEFSIGSCGLACHGAATRGRQLLDSIASIGQPQRTACVVGFGRRRIGTNARRILLRGIAFTTEAEYLLAEPCPL